MAQENLVDWALARAAAEGFAFCLEIVADLSHPTKDEVVQRLFEVARGEATMGNTLTEELADTERYHGGPLSAEVRRRFVDTATPSWLALNQQNQLTAQRIANCMADSVVMQRLIQPATQCSVD